MSVKYVEINHVGDGNYHFRIEYNNSEIRIYYNLTLEQLTDILTDMIALGELNPTIISEFNL